MIYALLLSIMALFSPLSSVSTCDEEKELAWIVNANSTLNANSAISNNDLKFIAVYGFTLEIPGLTEKEELIAKNIKNYTALKGTTDALCSSVHGELVAKARKYAFTYNKLIGAAK